jgi:hypothetical protein
VFSGNHYCRMRRRKNNEERRARKKENMFFFYFRSLVKQKINFSVVWKNMLKLQNKIVLKKKTCFDSFFV